VSVLSDTKAMTGHSDLVLGHVAARDPELMAAVRAWRDRVGAIPGPFEAWLAHRSLATLDVRLERMCANAAAVAAALDGHPAVRWVRWPGVGPVLAFELAGQAEAEAFLERAELVDDATSFGGVHTTAERRVRWGTDAVGPGFVRFSAGLEATEDLVADVLAALA
jgi:cystathionine gamma-lyase